LKKVELPSYKFYFLDLVLLPKMLRPDEIDMPAEKHHADGRWLDGKLLD
jgi:hypothetical protein